MLCTSCEYKNQCEETEIPLGTLSRLIIMSSVGATRENLLAIYDDFKGKDMDQMYRKASAIEMFCPLADEKNSAGAYNTSA